MDGQVIETEGLTEHQQTHLSRQLSCNNTNVFAILARLFPSVSSVYLKQEVFELLLTLSFVKSLNIFALAENLCLPWWHQRTTRAGDEYLC